MNDLYRVAGLALGSSLLVSCASAPPPPPPPEPRYAVEVESDPPAAEVRWDGTNVGSTPLSLKVRAERDLIGIDATRPNQEVVEKRIRFLGDDRAKVYFRFGTEGSSLAKKLGLTKVLVLENSERISFDSGQSLLRTEGIAVLQKQASILKTYFPTVDVFVCGHTDSTGGDSLNLRLSVDRARTVADFLVKEGVDRGRLKVEGFGKEFPVEPNDSPARRAVNRRTELVLPQ